MPVEEAAGAATVVGVAGDTVTLDGPLPAGAVAYRLPPAGGLVADGDAAVPLAGTPGFAFARVLVGADGQPMVPHFAAVDVASDNRLMPTASWTSTHRFSTACDDPTVEARLLHRPAPLALAQERQWDLRDAVMAVDTAQVQP